MNYSDAHVHGSAYRHRGHYRSRQASPVKVGRRFGLLILNLCLLVGGGALFGVAIHYYFLAQDFEAKNTLDSIGRAESYYGRTISYSLLGAIPLGLGIRGEARRLRRSRRRRKARKDTNS